MSALTASLRHHQGDAPAAAADSKSSSASSSAINSLKGDHGAASSTTNAAANIVSVATSSASALVPERLSPSEVQDRADMLAAALTKPGSEQAELYHTTHTVQGFIITNLDGDILRSHGTLDDTSGSGRSEHVAHTVRQLLLNVHSFLHTNTNASNSGSSTIGEQTNNAVHRVCVSFKRENYVISHVGNVIVIVQQGATVAAQHTQQQQQSGGGCTGGTDK